MSDDFKLTIEPTPNPNTRKFSWGREIAPEGPYDFPSERTARTSPLALKLFGVNGVLGVFIGRDFVAVSKHEGVSWDSVGIKVAEVLEEHVASGAPVIDAEAAAAAAATDTSAVEAKIREILDREIRPAVAMDGGDVVFVGFRDGVVSLQLRGACHGCPSSMATLKQGIEVRMKQLVPEVEEVMAIM